MEDDPEAIRQQIEATRHRMADTAEAIAFKADVPARVKDDVADRVDAVKSAVSDAAATVSGTLAQASHVTKDNVSDATGNAQSKLADATDAARTNLADFAETAKQRLAGTTAAASDLADAAKQRLSGTTAAASDIVARTKESARVPSSDTARAYVDNARSVITENPLGLALGAIAAGFLVGLALPVSDVERDNVGPLGERVAEKAKAAASDLAEQGKAAVASAVSEAFGGTSPSTSAHKSNGSSS